MKANRRSFIKAVASGGIAALLSSRGWELANRFVRGSAKEGLGPNLVVLLADDMRWDAILQRNI